MTSSRSSSAEFPSTHWSIVLAAGDTRASREALEELCRLYWLPVYAFVRNRTPNVEDARDLTQEILTRLLDGKLLRTADPARGRFRSLLLTAVRNFLVNQHERASAQKRGGGLTVLSLDFESAESRIACETVDADTPERLFDRKWAIALLDAVLNQLHREFIDAGKSDHFEAMKPYLTGDDTAANHAELAKQLGNTPSAARAAVYRFRKRYRELLRSEIAQTVSGPSEVEEELRDLFRAFE